MSDTDAIPLDFLNDVNGGHGRPPCPRCSGGRLHPYKVTFNIARDDVGYGTKSLEGWVAVCVGDDGVQPCGLSVPLTPQPN